jgi:hypothetical protein
MPSPFLAMLALQFRKLFNYLTCFTVGNGQNEPCLVLFSCIVSKGINQFRLEDIFPELARQ